MTARLLAANALFLLAPAALPLRAQSQTPKFDVASIKRCKPEAAVRGAGRGAGGSRATDRLVTGCDTVFEHIRGAYIFYAGGQIHPPLDIPPIEGGPAWMRSDRYQIEAKTEADPPPSAGMMHGPMLQALLEERFQLKLHHETRQVAAYALTVAKGGAKLHATAEGSCAEMGKLPPRSQPGQRPKICGMISMPHNGGAVSWDGRGLTMGELCKFLATGFDRPVIDKTFIAGRFDIHMEFAADENAHSSIPEAIDLGAPPADPTGVSIFTALKRQLGLQLESTKGPRDFLVIDRIERPTEN